MPKILTLCLFLATFIPKVGNCSIFSICDDLALFKSQTTNAIANQHNEYSAFKVDTMKSLADIQLKVGNIDTNLNAKIDARVQAAVTGLDLKIDNSSKASQQGNNNSVNDTKLMMQIVHAYQHLCVLLITQFVGLVIMYIKKDAKSDTWAEEQITRLSQK